MIYFFFQTAHCYIHAAALVAEYLKRQGKLLTLTLKKQLFTSLIFASYNFLIIESIG